MDAFLNHKTPSLHPRIPQPGEPLRCQAQGRGRQPMQDVGRAGFVWLLPLPLGQKGTTISLPQPFGSQISAYTQLLGLAQEQGEGLENSLSIQLTEMGQKGHKSFSGKAGASSQSIYRIRRQFFWVLLLTFIRPSERQLVIAGEEMTVSKGRGIKLVLPWREEKKSDWSFTACTTGTRRSKRRL